MLKEGKEAKYIAMFESTSFTDYGIAKILKEIAMAH
jgi:hypothetical protein